MASFEIEKVFEIPTRGWFVMARCVEGARRIDGGPGFLGPLPVDGGTVPRKTDDRGAPHTDIWIFRLAAGAEPGLVSPGESVQWSPLVSGEQA